MPNYYVHVYTIIHIYLCMWATAYDIIFTIPFLYTFDYNVTVGLLCKCHIHVSGVFTHDITSAVYIIE